MSLSGTGDILASKRETVTFTINTQDPTRLAATRTNLPVLIQLPPKTRNVRIAVQTVEGGRIGTAELDRKTIDAAPEAPTPPPSFSLALRCSMHRRLRSTKHRKIKRDHQTLPLAVDSHWIDAEVGSSPALKGRTEQSPVELAYMRRSWPDWRTLYLSGAAYANNIKSHTSAQVERSVHRAYRLPGNVRP